MVPVVEVGLDAVIVAVADETPRVLTLASPPDARDLGDRLPSGALDPAADRTLDLSLRRWVREQTGIELGYLEQLYTFGDRDRSDPGRRLLSIAYLALTREQALSGSGAPAWRSWYDYLPWEDWRDGVPAVIGSAIVPGLERWESEATEVGDRQNRRSRAEIAFGLGAASWDPVRVLDRYELLYEAQLVPESARVARPELGAAMALDHRRIAATALERLRGKLSYRPVVFELLPETFTLLRLQRVVEALVGVRLHKSNFRRLVEQAQLVERTGELDAPARGRPAELFRFLRDVVRERPAPGVSLPRRFPR